MRTQITYLLSMFFFLHSTHCSVAYTVRIVFMWQSGDGRLF